MNARRSTKAKPGRRAPKKVREGLDEELAATVLFDSNRTCCVCGERGREVQIHHINEDPSDNRPSNLAVLCLHCHDQTQQSGGFGRKLNAAQIVRYRDDWTARVRIRRNAAEKVAGDRAGDRSPARRASPASLIPYVHSLPTVLEKARELGRLKWAAGTPAAEAAAGGYDVVEVLRTILVHLTSWFPPGHFAGRPATELVDEHIRNRFTWLRGLAEPTGEGGFGTFITMQTTAGVIAQLESDVADVVASLLTANNRRPDWDGWKAAWDAASVATAESNDHGS